MYYFKQFLKKLHEDAKIDFDILSNDGVFLFKTLEEDKETVSCSISLGNRDVSIKVYKDKQQSIEILRMYIEDMYRDMSYLKEQFLSDVLHGNKVSADQCTLNIPNIENGYYILILSIEKYRHINLHVIQESYEDSKIISMIYDDNLILLISCDDIQKEAKDVLEKFKKDFKDTCYISYGKAAYSIEDIKKSYDQAMEAMEFGKRLSRHDNIFDYSSMFFERAVFSISDKVKIEFYNEFKDKLNSFDDDMINTIEEFISCNLNISEVAKKLYIHRNTLIYRLEKIAKDTGYDIRNFKDAATFTIAFLIWKELKK